MSLAWCDFQSNVHKMDLCLADCLLKSGWDLLPSDIKGSEVAVLQSVSEMAEFQVYMCSHALTGEKFLYG